MPVKKQSNTTTKGLGSRKLGRPGSVASSQHCYDGEAHYPDYDHAIGVVPEKVSGAASMVVPPATISSHRMQS